VTRRGRSHRGLRHQVCGGGEATAFGHPEVDVEHLLLGLMVVSGPSAEVLTAAGVELTALCRAVGEVQREDLGELGVDVATPQPPPVRAADRPHQVLPLNGRAAELMEAVAYRNDDPGFLEALLADGSGRVRRLLDHLDVDVALASTFIGTGWCEPRPGEFLAACWRA
jgi:hypothetical protein